MNTFKHKERPVISVGDKYCILPLPTRGCGFSVIQGDIVIEDIANGMVRYHYTITKSPLFKPIHYFNASNIRRVE